ncbi:MAG: hypothetical protein ACI4TJ_07585 [Candidatus Cryptobacteroides sp.]
MGPETTVGRGAVAEPRTEAHPPRDHASEAPVAGVAVAEQGESAGKRPV